MRSVGGVDVYGNNAEAQSALSFREREVKDIATRVLGSIGKVDFSCMDVGRVYDVFVAIDGFYGAKMFSVDLAVNSIRVRRDEAKYLEGAVRIASECKEKGIGEFFVIEHND